MRDVTRHVGRACNVKAILSACLLFGLLALALPLEVEASIGDYRCSDPSRVYHGNPRLIRKPAVVSADQIYARIPEYRQICEQGLTDKDVRYHFLMKKASERFAKAVKAAARALGYDCVAEVGCITVEREGAAAPADCTSDVISRLS